MLTMKEVIGKITGEEKKEILDLYKRKKGLEELPSSLERIVISEVTKKIVQEKVIIESQKLKADVQDWWDRIFKKYNLKKEEGKDWHINLETGEIFFD